MTLAVISHPSKQGNMYRIPAGAALSGFETVFLTGYYWRGPGAALKALKAAHPAAAARIEAVLERRRLGDLDPRSVRRISGPLPELLYRVAEVMGLQEQDSLFHARNFGSAGALFRSFVPRGPPAGSAKNAPLRKAAIAARNVSVLNPNPRINRR